MNLLANGLRKTPHTNRIFVKFSICFHSVADTMTPRGVLILSNSKREKCMVGFGEIQ